MNDTITQLIAEKKYDELRTLINSAIQQEFSTKERGEALLDLTVLYLDIINAINSRHQASLEDIATRLKAINATEATALDAIDLKMVRAKLNPIQK